jgi:outer membrane protein TolC
LPAPKKPIEEVSVLTAKVESRKADVDKAKADLALAKAQYDRLKQLFDTGVSAKADVDTAAATLQSTQAKLRAAEAELAVAEAALKAAQPQLPKVINTPKYPQSKLPARVGFPTPQDTFALAQLDLEVANLRFEVAQVEVKQLEALGITGEQLDAAKVRYAEAKKGLHAAEDKVLAAQKKLDPFGK